MNKSDLITAGRYLSAHGLVTHASGNLSYRSRDRLVITRTGCQLENLTEDDLIETGIFSDDANTKLASSELPVHRAIYRATDAKAIVHAHPAAVVTLSVQGNTIASSEADEVPVTGWGTEELIPGAFAADISEALKTYRMVVVYGHGSFAIGDTLEAACADTVALEAYCRTVCDPETLLADREGQKE